MNISKSLNSKWWNNHKLPVLFFVLICAALILGSVKNDYFASLGSNLVAEFIGAATTVFGIDYLIKQREENRLLPVKASSYEDVRVMTHWALDLWKEAYLQSVGDTQPSSWKELFSRESLYKIQVSLDVTKPAKVIPIQPWSTYFEFQMGKIHQHAERVLERHGAVLDPKIHSAVYTLIYHGGHNISNIMALDRQIGCPRPTNLGGYYPIIPDWFEAILILHEWTIVTHKYLSQNNITSIHGPYLFGAFTQNNQPPARFDEGVLEEQCQVFTNWQKQK